MAPRLGEDEYSMKSPSPSLGACREMTTVEVLESHAKDLRMRATEIEKLADALRHRTLPQEEGATLRYLLLNAISQTRR